MLHCVVGYVGPDHSASSSCLTLRSVRTSNLTSGDWHTDYSSTTDVYLGLLPWCLEVPKWTLSKELHDWCLAQFVLHILPA